MTLPGARRETSSLSLLIVGDLMLDEGLEGELHGPAPVAPAPAPKPAPAPTPTPPKSSGGGGGQTPPQGY